MLNYRRAFKLDPRADKTYHQHEQHIAALKLDSDLFPRSQTETDELEFDFKRTVQLGPDYQESHYKKERHPSSTAALLDSLMDSFHHNPFTYPDVEDGPAQPLDWLPDNLQLPCRLQMLPDEIIAHIFVHLIRPGVPHGTPKISLLECTAALVCRKARLISLSADVWKEACKTVLVPPYQLPPASSRANSQTLGSHPSIEVDDDEVFEETLNAVQHHGNDWRRCFIEQPRSLSFIPVP